jgi:hypothetical protein
MSYLKWIGAGVVAVALVAAAYLYLREEPSFEATPPLPAAEETGPKHAVLGHSVEGRTIDAYTYGSGDARILFAGGMHGGYEWNSVLLAYMAMDYFDAHPDVIPPAFSVTVIPNLNPDGVYRVVGKEGRFSAVDVPEDADEAAGRFNAHEVDLNRNFDCKWQSTSSWRSQEVSAGTEPFSEPESAALRKFVEETAPVAAVFWHSQANAVYASECEDGILQGTRDIMEAYAAAAGYPTVDTFDAYPISGDAEGWLASIGIPAITVELKTHESVEWEKNLAGMRALLAYFNGT